MESGGKVSQAGKKTCEKGRMLKDEERGRKDGKETGCDTKAGKKTVKLRGCRQSIQRTRFGDDGSCVIVSTTGETSSSPARAERSPVYLVCVVRSESQ